MAHNDYEHDCEHDCDGYCEPSDDDRADDAWASAAVKTMTADAAAVLWPLAVGAALALFSWPMAVAGAVALGGWAIAVMAGAGVLACARVVWGLREWKAKRHLPPPPAAPASPSWRFWLSFVAATLPRAGAAAYALSLVAPAALSVALGLLIAGWPLLNRLVLIKSYERGAARFGQWEHLLGHQRPPGGLPTPEI